MYLMVMNRVGDRYRFATIDGKTKFLTIEQLSIIAKQLKLVDFNINEVSDKILVYGDNETHGFNEYILIPMEISLDENREEPVFKYWMRPHHLDSLKYEARIHLINDLNEE